jgi:hypothetical protein
LRYSEILISFSRED